MPSDIQVSFAVFLWRPTAAVVALRDQEAGYEVGGKRSEGKRRAGKREESEGTVCLGLRG